jgi:hypothetical protein
MNYIPCLGRFELNALSKTIRSYQAGEIGFEPIALIEIVAMHLA